MYIGIAMAWPLWWVSVASVLCLLSSKACIVNVVLARRDGVTVGTDDDGPGLRLAVVGLATAALAAAVVVGYTQWTVPDRAPAQRQRRSGGHRQQCGRGERDLHAVESDGGDRPGDRMMTPDRAEKYKNEFSAVAKQLTARTSRPRPARSRRASRPSARRTPASR